MAEWDVNDMDAFLMKRAVPKAPDGLAERIIAAAYREQVVVPTRKRKFFSGLSGFIANSIQAIFLPRPAYAFAAIALLVVVTAVSSNVEFSATGVSHQTYDISDDLEAVETQIIWGDDADHYL